MYQCPACRRMFNTDGDLTDHIVVNEDCMAHVEVHGMESV